MSLRAEYTHAAVFNKDARQWEVTVFHHEAGSAKVVGRESVNFEFLIKACATRLISAHMEKVTRILEGGIPPENGEATDMTTIVDHLAHKADHDNQCEKDKY